MCFRYLGYTSFRDIDLLDYRECRIIEDAVRLKLVDRSYAAHLTAWLSMAAKARRRSGSAVYKKFGQFFNYEKHEAEARKKETTGEVAGKLPGLANYYREKRRKKKADAAVNAAE